MAPKKRGNNRVGLSLRGKHRGAALEARKETWRKSKMSGDPSAFKEPGSSKK